MTEQSTGQPEVDSEADDPVTAAIAKTGCLPLHYAVQECMYDHKDWRKCQKEVTDFRQCIETHRSGKSSTPASKST